MKSNHHTQRPHSAPTSLVELNTDHKKDLSRISKDEQLCPWNIGPTPIRKTTKKTRDTKGNNNKSTNCKPTISGISTRKTQSSSNASTKSRTTKWYLRASKESQLDFEYGFQHFTDTTRYMSDYRERKMVKIHENYAQEIESFFSTDPCLHTHDHFLNLGTRQNLLKNTTQQVILQPYHDKDDIVSFSYRFDGSKGYDERLRKQQSPMKVRGKCLEQDEEKKRYDKKDKESNNKRNVNYYTLPKCDSVFIPSKPNNNNYNQGSGECSLQSDYMLQCRKLNELSIQKAPQHLLTSPSKKYALQDNLGWKANHRSKARDTVKLRSAEERRNQNVSVSSVKSNDYSHIIKRVLEHYDPSQNQVRAGMTSQLSGQKSLLTST